MTDVLLNEALETDRGLLDYLSADSELSSITNGVYSQFPGIKSVRTPIVSFFLVESDDLMNVSGNRVWAELVYQIEAVTGGYDTTDLLEISRRLDELLHLLRGQTWGNVLVEEIYRRQPLFRRELNGDQPYAYAGGEYVFHVSAQT